MEGQNFPYYLPKKHQTPLTRPCAPPPRPPSDAHALFWGPNLNFYEKYDFWKTTICHQRLPSDGRKGGRCTHDLLYFIFFIEIFPLVFRVVKNLGFKWRKSIRVKLKSIYTKDFRNSTKWERGQTKDELIIWIQPYQTSFFFLFLLFSDKLSHFVT